MKEQLESLNSLSINFGDGGMAIVNIILAFVMFGVALGIICAVDGLRTSLKAMERMSRGKEENKPPVSFNDHD